MQVKTVTPVSKNLRHEEKTIYAKIDKDLYTAFRIWCFQKGVTVSEVLIEITKRLVTGDKRANGLIDSYILRTLSLPSPPKKVKSDKVVELSEEDKVSLYDIISGNIQEEDDGLDQENNESDV